MRCMCAIVVGLLGCAGEFERGEVPLRTGSRDAAPLDAAADVGAPFDAMADGMVDGADASLDAAPDASPDAGWDPPPRALWVVVRDDVWSSGVRGRLLPPHRPVGDPLDALPDAAVLVRWAGPGASDRLEAALADPRRAVAPIWALGARLDGRVDAAEARAVATADASWLAARLPEARRPLRVSAIEGRGPVDPAETAAVDGLLVLVEADWTDPLAAEALAAARDRAEGLGVAIGWGALVDPRVGVVPDGVDGVSPSCAVDEPAARARQRIAAAEAGRWWLPCVSPPINPRLDDEGRAAEPPTLDALRRVLVLARRAGTAAVVVDGVGGWRDDRQLDPVEGSPTAEPFPLTTGLLYRPYGRARLAVVHDTLRRPTGPMPSSLADPPALVELVRTAGVSVERVEVDGDGLAVALRDVGGGGRYELLLDDRPWRLPGGAALRYRRSDPAVALDLVFADGTRLLDALPAGDAGLDVEVSLAPFAGRRVEELTLVYRGGVERLDARVERPTIVTGE